MYQRTERVARLRAVLLADEPVVGERREEPLADPRLDRRVGLRHERPVRLGIDREVAAEMRPGDHVGLVAGGLGDLQPAAQLRVGAAPEARGPVAPERRAAHARIRSPAGSHSGSRMTSKPIQSPKTSTSPRVPMAASGGR